MSFFHFLFFFVKKVKKVKGQGHINAIFDMPTLRQKRQAMRHGIIMFDIETERYTPKVSKPGGTTLKKISNFKYFFYKSLIKKNMKHFF